MRIFFMAVLCAIFCVCTSQQSNAQPLSASPDNIYSVRQQYLYKVLHNPAEQEDGDADNDLERFNRWFHLAEARCYPSGDLPRPDVILTAMQNAKGAPHSGGGRTTSGTANGWEPVGPMQIPIGNDGIGRVNCIVISPNDTNTLYIGTACGGVFISHNGGNTWTSNTDNFPSLSIADIAVNPHNTDTIYAATGDGYGYETGSDNIFWGGLYSAGVMMSADGGNTWQTTGLSFLQSDRDIIQRLLIKPDQPNILLAATRAAMLRTTDGGNTWTGVDSGHIYSMAFKPGNPNTIYSINQTDLRVSHDAGATWSTLYAGLNPANDRCSIATSAASPNSIWVLDANDSVRWSHDQGATFTTTSASPSTIASFYGYYDRVLAISPSDSNYILAFGENMAHSLNNGGFWSRLNPRGSVHVDNHAATINPLNTATIYTGNDGGIAVTHDGGATWTNLANGLMISQIYKISTSPQAPYQMICGLQDNGTLTYNGTNWTAATGGDGEACAIDPVNNQVQVSSYQNGHFFMSYDGGSSFSAITVTSEYGAWTAPVAIDPTNDYNIYYGYKDIFASNDQGVTFVALTTDTPFAPDGANVIAVAPSDGNYIYACNYGKLIRTTDAGITWNNVTGNLPVASEALSNIAVDPRNPMLVYATMSGYVSGNKVYMSTTGGRVWTNISGSLPNIPADCIAIDSSTPGAIFVGTDMGVYYKDSTTTGWQIYTTGLPNVIANDLNINYGNYKIRVATYGRGVWESNLKKQPTAVPQLSNVNTYGARIYPNPAKDSWQLMFDKTAPANFEVKLADINGHTISTQKNAKTIDAAGLASGIYNIDVIVNEARYSIKAVKY